MRAVLMMAAAVLAVAGAPARGRAEVRNPDAVAVIVGNRNYQNHDIPAVTFADRDAASIRRYVIDVLGYDERNVIFLDDATQGRLLNVFGSADAPKGQLARWLRPGGRSDVLVYYSGHGVPGIADAQSYLLPVDADPNSVSQNGYPLKLLYENLQKIGARSVTVLLDACFSGSSAGGTLLPGASVMTRPASPVPAADTGGLTVLTASQADQVANWDGKHQHGLFTEYFLEAVYGRADDPQYGGHRDGKITLAAVHSYLDTEMSYVAQREDGRDQTVTVIGDPGFVLAMIVPKQPPPRRDPEPTVPAVVPPPPPHIVAAPPPPAIDAGALEKQGESARRMNDYPGAMRLFQQAADLGNVRAMTNLGLLYNGGRPDMQPDYKVALNWFLRAAGAGDAEAEYEIGMMCKLGRNGPVDSARARYWFDLAAKHGDMAARQELNRRS